VFSVLATESILQFPRRRQLKVKAFALQLAAHPFVPGDYAVTDESGRCVEHQLIEEFVFAYWVDHAVCEVRITDISDAN